MESQNSSQIPLRVYSLVDESEDQLNFSSTNTPEQESGEKDDRRKIVIGEETTEKFGSNEVSTSRYTLLTWAPKSLLWQFRRVANIYFLVISILTAMPFSPKSPFSMIGTFAAVLIFTMFKEAYEDYFRHKQDKQVNNQTVHVLTESAFTDKKSKDIRVGDIVEVREGEFIPADLLFLSSSNPKGVAFVNTMNLDGETNLKEKLPIALTAELNCSENLRALRIHIRCDQPNPNMHSWSCKMKIDNSSWEPLGNKQFLMRGCLLKNTKSAFGVVVYTGHDTKIMLNSKNPPSKISDVFRKMNKLLYTLFTFQFIICTTYAGLHLAWLSRNSEDHTYLDLDTDIDGGDYFIQILTFWVAYSHLIPISLYVALEVLKLTQTYLISQDLEMYYAEEDKPANPRNSDLVEELGQVEFVFSDKTGTLTRNEMIFRRFSISDQSFDHGQSSTEAIDSSSADLRNSFNDFFKLLSVCHSVFPTVENGQIMYQAPSPDELALVSAAADSGFRFVERTENFIGVECKSGLEKWEICAEIPFVSERKRMSIVVKDPQGTVYLMTKGADSIMCNLLASKPPSLDRTIHDFAVEGLRTLVMAQRELSKAEYESWMSKYKHLSLSSAKNKDDMIYDHAETIEKNLQLIGVSAIEDKLQAGVPETIDLLIRGNIRVWVLTGDKQETAIEIGKSCNLIADSMKLIILSSTSSEEIKQKLLELASYYSLHGKSFAELEEDRKSYKKQLNIVVDGVTLTWIMEIPDLREYFFRLGFVSKSCICCRVTPLQKLQVVALAKEHGSWVTLSIGDGANDVSMIQEAHIGVGIAGKEGTQAVQSSDFAIGQFAYLGDLLFVHGRWAYKRVSTFICYYFYKNIVLVCTELWFAFFNGFSGQIFFLDWLSSLYNSFWTSWPCLVAYALEQDVDAVNSKKYPHLYGAGQNKVFFNFKIFWMWVSFAAWHGGICYWVIVGGFQNPNSDGIDYGLWGVSTIAFTLVIHIVTIKLFLETNHWTILNGAVCAASVFFYYISVLVLCTEGVSGTFQPEAPWLFMNVLDSGKVWIAILFVPLLALIPDIAVVGFLFVFKPNPTQYLSKMIND